MDAGFRCEPENKKTRRDEDAGYKANFEANLGSKVATCFCLTRYNVMIQVEAVHRELKVTLAKCDILHDRRYLP